MNRLKNKLLTMTRSLRDGRGRTIKLAAIALTVAVLWLILFLAYGRQVDTAVAEARQALDVRGRFAAGYLDFVLSKVDETTHAVWRAQRQAAQPRGDLLRQSGVELDPNAPTTFVAVIGLDGAVSVIGARERAQAILNAAQILDAHREDPEGRMRAHAPIADPAGGEAMVLISRRLETSSFGFAGAVVAGLPAGSLVPPIGPSGIRATQLAWVLGRSDGAVRAALNGELLAAEQLRALSAATGAAAGDQSVGALQFDIGAPWIVAWRGEERAGLIIAVAMARADAIAALWSLWLPVLVFGLGFTWIVLLLVAFMLLDATDLRRTEAKILASEARIQDFLSGAVDWFWETDAQHKFTMISDGARTVGINPTTRIGRSHADLVPSEVASSARFRSFRAQLDRRQSFKDVVLPIQVASDARRFVSMSGMPVIDDAGLFLGYRGSARDVSADISARERLAQSERQLREISAYVPGVLVRFERKADGAFQIPFVSERVREIFGVTPDVVQRRAEALYDVVLVDDLHRYQSTIEESAHSLQPWICEYRISIAGRTKWVRGHAIPEAHGDGAVVWNGILTDITDRKHAEENLQRSESRFRDGVESMSDAFTLFDRDNFLVVWNKRFEQLFPELAPQLRVGLAFEELVEGTAAMPQLGLVEPEQRERWIQERLRHRKRRGEPFEIGRADGRTILATERDTEEGGLVSVYRDVTDERRAADELRRAKDAAEASERAKGEFLATMSHEIRTPMNGVIGMIALLLESELAEEQRRTATIIRDSSEALLQIINDVLDLSKLEAGKMELERMAFDPRQVVGGSLDIMGTRAREKGLLLAHEIGEDVPASVIGDPGRLRQILLNLVGNAIKFTERGAVRIAVRAATRTAEDATLEFSVSDTGIGIPADAVSRLFGDFVQVDSSISRRYGGTGLGLSICRRLVNAMGGAIGVDSEPGCGSVFRFTVKVAIARAAQARPESAESAVDSAAVLASLTATLQRPLRVLLAEDNRTNQLVAVTMLQKSGIAVDAAGNGVEAVEAVTNRDYDLVLMDVHMPDMDGIAATEAIRRLPGAKSAIPIVALTANVLQADIDRCYEAGMNDFIAKPFRKAQLLATIARHLPLPSDVKAVA